MDLKELLANFQTMESRIASLTEKAALADTLQKELNELKKGFLVGGGRQNEIGTKGYSDEERAMRYFQVSHPRDLLNVNTGAKKFRNVPRELKALVVMFKQEIDIARWTQQLLYGEPLDLMTANGELLQASNVKGVIDGNYFGKSILATRVKAFSIASDPAASWINTATSTQYIEEYELERLVAQRFRSIIMPSNPYKLPKQTSRTRARIQAENNTIADVTFGTDKITFDATKLAEHYVLSEEITEDSAPDILAVARLENVEAIPRAIEDTICNGDDSVSHMDSDVVSAADNRKAWKGTRKLALANSAVVDFGNAAASKTNLRSMRKLMGKYGLNPSELFWLVSATPYYQMLDIEQVTTQEKFGGSATIRTGVLDIFDGIDIIKTEWAREDLNAAGVHDGVTTNRKVITLVNQTRAMLGVRKEIRTVVTRHPVPPNDQWMLVSWWRGDWQANPQSASEVSISLGVNVA